VTDSESNRLPAWRDLSTHQRHVAPLHMRDLFAADQNRFQRFSLQACELFLDYSKNRITEETMTLLVELARQTRVEATSSIRASNAPLCTWLCVGPRASLFHRPATM